MKIKLLDEPYLKGIWDWKAVDKLNDKLSKLEEEGKIPYCSFIPLPIDDCTLAEVSDLSVLKVIGIEKYEIINQ